MVNGMLLGHFLNLQITKLEIRSPDSLFLLLFSRKATFLECFTLVNDVWFQRATFYILLNEKSNEFWIYYGFLNLNSLFDDPILELTFEVTNTDQSSIFKCTTNWNQPNPPCTKIKMSNLPHFLPIPWPKTARYTMFL